MRGEWDALVAPAIHAERLARRRQRDRHRRLDRKIAELESGLRGLQAGTFQRLALEFVLQELRQRRWGGDDHME